MFVRPTADFTACFDLLCRDERDYRPAVRVTLDGIDLHLSVYHRGGGE